MPNLIEFQRFISTQLRAEVSRKRLEIFREDDVPTVTTAAGKIRFEPASLVMTPISLQVIRLHELYLRSQGVTSGFALTAVADLSVLHASRSYFAGQCALLGQLMACPLPHRIELACGLLNAMAALKRRGGLESVLLNCAAALDIGAPGPDVVGPDMAQQIQKLREEMFRRLPEMWELLDGVHGGPPVELPEGTGRDRSRHLFGSQVSPVVTASSGTIRFVPTDQIGSMLTDATSLTDLTQKIEMTAARGVNPVGVQIEQVMEHEYEKCVAAFSAAGALVFGSMAAAAAVSSGVGTPAALGAGMAGFEFGNTVGGWIGTWSCSDVTPDDARNQSSLVSTANDARSAGHTSGSSSASAETGSAGQSTQTGSGDGSATDAGDDESAVCKPDDDKGKPNPTEYASSRFDTVTAAGPGLRSVVVRAGTVLQLTSLPRLANDGVRLAEPGLFAALPGVQKVETVVRIEGVRDVLAELAGRR